MLVDGKCLEDVATMHLVGNTSLGLKRTTVSQLENDFLVYSSYAGPKYWRDELEEVNSIANYQMPLTAMFNLFSK